jgi:FkbM family methyltransferase
VTGARIVLRDAAAAMSRALPQQMRGRARIGLRLQNALTDYRDDRESLVSIGIADGARLRVDLRSPTERRVFWTGAYDAEVVAAIGRFLWEGDTLLDVGANIGFYTVPLGRRLRGLGGTLWAFEPFGPNFERLRENVAANDLEDVVHVVNVALGDREGSVTLRPEPGGRTGNAVAHDGGDVRSTTLDTLAREHAVGACAFLKIDVEGSELACLRGAAGLLDAHRPVVLAELNPFWMGVRGWTYADLSDFAATHGYAALRGGTRGAIENALLVPEETTRPVDGLARAIGAA